jgi:hypothetical protein
MSYEKNEKKEDNDNCMFFHKIFNGALCSISRIIEKVSSGRYFDKKP